uniref:Uncharacterized protein n=1 Tax=Glossina austeni TaxID=7395 RepID=A0A1A9UVW6_GLOAU
MSFMNFELILIVFIAHSNLSIVCLFDFIELPIKAGRRLIYVKLIGKVKDYFHLDQVIETNKKKKKKKKKSAFTRFMKSKSPVFLKPRMSMVPRSLLHYASSAIFAPYICEYSLTLSHIDGFARFNIDSFDFACTVYMGFSKSLTSDNADKMLKVNMSFRRQA